MKEIKALKIKKLALTGSPATEEEFVILKSEKPEGMSDKEYIWLQLQQGRDKFMLNANIKQPGQSAEAVKQITNEQAMSEYLKTDAGRKLYAQYESASDERTPIQKSLQGCVETIDKSLEGLALQYQNSHGGTYEQAYDNILKTDAGQNFYEVRKWADNGG